MERAAVVILTGIELVSLTLFVGTLILICYVATHF